MGERSGACDAVERAIIAELLIVVLTGLGGASQERSAARNFFGPRLIWPEINRIFVISRIRILLSMKILLIVLKLIAVAQQPRRISLCSREIIQIQPQHPAGI